MTAPTELISELRTSRDRFLALVEPLRPELHRYCARMTGSVTDGEDVVQDTLARAYFSLGSRWETDELPALRPWLFRIAHNRAIDVRRRYDQRMRDARDVDATSAPDAASPSEAVDRARAVAAAVAQFVELVPLQRSCVILKDVLDHSVDDIAELLQLTVPAVKAGLHRGRARLRSLREAAAPASAPSRHSVRYAELFNARDWDGVRGMLAEDVRLELVARMQRRGRGPVGTYVTNYAHHHDWWLVPAWLDGREVLAVTAGQGQPVRYVIELAWDGEQISEIRDFRYIDYIVRDAVVSLAVLPPDSRSS